MNFIKRYIKKFIRNNRFIRNQIMTFNMLYFGKTIFQENSLLSSVLNFNHLIEKKYNKNFINVFDIGCFGEIPQPFMNLKNFNFYGIDIDSQEIERQRKYHTNENFNFFNFKVVEPNDLVKFRQKFVDRDLDPNLFTIEKVQSYNHNISSSKLSDLNKNQNFTKKYFTQEKITIDDAYQNLIKPKEINFLKIDTDVNDHEILYGADKLLSDDKFFGVQIEVDYVKPRGSKFRNFVEVLRYMNYKNFNLFNFVNSKYSSEFLPTRYLYSFPGPNDNGSPLMGDLVFFKNFDEDFLKKLNEDDIIKILRLLEIYNQDHIAIELINRVKDFSDEKKNEFKSEFIKKYSLKFFGEIFDYDEYCERYRKDKNKFLNII